MRSVTLPENADKKLQDTKDTEDQVKSVVDEMADEYKNTGITTITQRRVVIGPDGRRRVLTRRKIVNTPPEGKTDE
jgi:hypothetical protein